jgi:peptidyl-prolyl cis-trans isomerase SurA
MKKAWFGIIAVSALALTGADVIDRIAAVVNDDIILLSEVEEKLFIFQTQGQLEGRDSTEVAQLRREIIDRLIEETLVVQRAKSQGIDVKPEEVMSQVDDAMQRVRSRFPSLDAFRAALAEEGISESMLRERYQSDVEQEILGQRIVGREVRSQVTITSDDVQKYFEENRDDLPQKPMEVHLAHVLVNPVSPEREQAGREKIETARERILGGEEFEKVAEEMSDDPSQSRGGMLGWFSRGDLDTDFEAAAESLAVNQLSEVVRTTFGFHLIEVLNRDGERFEVRHILALVESSTRELEDARRRATEAWERIQGGDPFEDVAREGSDDELTREDGGDLGWTPVQFLLPTVQDVVDTLEVGEVSTVTASDRGFHVFRVLNRRSGGEFEFEEIKDRLRTFLEQKKLEEVYDEWMTGVRDSAYVEIRAWNR